MLKFYKVTFRPEITMAFNAMRGFIQFHYGNNAWSADEHPVYVIQTKDTESEILNNIQSDEPHLYEGFETLDLKVLPTSATDLALPESAQQWVSSRQKTMGDLSKMLNDWGK